VRRQAMDATAQNSWPAADSALLPGRAQVALPWVAPWPAGVREEAARTLLFPPTILGPRPCASAPCAACALPLPLPHSSCTPAWYGAWPSRTPCRAMIQPSTQTHSPAAPAASPSSPPLPTQAVPRSAGAGR